MDTVSTISQGARPSIETINSTRIRSGKARDTSANQVINWSRRRRENPANRPSVLPVNSAIEAAATDIHSTDRPPLSKRDNTSCPRKS
ncbi:hypothetical protein D3C76_1645050 [compost metagenome]